MNNTYKKRHINISGIILIVVLFIGIFVGINQSYKIYEFFSKASGEKANISVDASSNLGGLARPWRNLAQGGEDKNWKIGNLKSQVASLHPMYIRLDHIYDFYDIVSKDNGQLYFHWETFDAVINDVLATGAKPFISLSYMPPAIAKSGDVTGLPEDWGEYQSVIYQTVKHLSKDRGISDIYYEVWNEPDLFGEWKTYGEKNYLTLYSVAAKGASQVQGAKTFKFGGSATTGLYKNWFEGLADYCVKNSTRLDFISWHRYSNDIEQYRKDMADANSWLQSYPILANTELLITEWGHDPKNNGGYDSQYSAAHTAAVATELSGIVNKAFVFEIQDGKDPEGKEYWGRWGLFTHNDFGAKQKPRYKALKMLDQLGDRKLQLLGKGTFVKGIATKDNDKVKILLANFDPNGSNSEVVPVKVTSLTASSYQLDISFLNAQKQTRVVQTENGILTTELPMGPNSVALLTLTPQ